MKDRDGNEWVLVPCEATEEMLIAGLNDCDPIGSLIDWDDSKGECTTRKNVADIYKAAIAAAPQFVAGAVTDEMIVRAFNHGMPHPRMATRYDKQVGMEWLAAWRSELGPALGLVTREEMARSVEIRDTEIARLETDLELARIEVARLRDALDQSALEYADLAVSAKSLEEHLHALVEVSEDSTIARARAVMNGDDIGEDEDAARAGNGGGV